MSKKVEIIIQAKDQAGRVFRKVSGEAESQLSRIRESALGLKGVLGGLFAGAAIYKIKSMTDEWERLAGMQEQADAGLRQAMISMGRYSDAAFEAIKRQADSLQETTTASNDAIEQGAKFLMTYSQIPDEVMPKVIETMVDLAALMKGDMVGAANMLGKASMGMTGELRRVGITVDQDTYKSKGFLGVLAQIIKQVGGQARALGETKQGGLIQFGNAMDDVKKNLGEVILGIKENLLPNLKLWAEGLNEITRAWKNLLGGNQDEMVLAHLRKQKAVMESQLAEFQGVRSGSGFLDKALGWIPGYITQDEAEAGMKILPARIALITKTIAHLQADAGKKQKRDAGKKQRHGPSSPDMSQKALSETTAAYYKRMKQELFGFHDAALQVWQAQQEMAVDALLSEEAGLDQLSQAHADYYADLTSNARETFSSLAELSQRTADAMEQNFSDLFFDAMTGRFKNLGDYATGVLRSIQRAAADMLGQMAKTALFGSGSEWGGGGLFGKLTGSFSGAGTSFGFGAPSLASGAYNELYGEILHSGGIVGETPFTRMPAAWFKNAPRLHQGLGPEEFPAILERGETVLPRGAGAISYHITINAVDAASFAQLAARNPGAIVGPVISELRAGNRGLRNTIRSIK